MIIRIFFAIGYPLRFLGYLGYQKSGINIASFDQWGSFWDVTCNLDFTCIPLRQNMANGKASSLAWLDIIGSCLSYPPNPKENQFVTIISRGGEM